eukprot:SAG31_NODE_5815_length_2312_cov_1.915047_3_plen_70_part_00
MRAATKFKFSTAVSKTVISGYSYVHPSVTPESVVASSAVNYLKILLNPPRRMPRRREHAYGAVDLNLKF